ncbi:MAG: hypothetical protein ACNA7X_03210, partial [Dehalococcoidia bacterium]
AGLAGTQATEAKIAAKADAGLLMEQVPDVTTLKQMAEDARGVPLGVLLKDADATKADELVAAGCDFLVVNTGSAAAVLGNEDAGKFLMLQPSLDLGMARAVNSLEVDGVFVSIGTGQPFVAVEHLLACRRFVDLLEKPVMLVLPSMVAKSDLAGLWQLGIDGIVAAPPQSVKSLAELKKMIEAIPGGPRGRRAKLGARIPGFAGAVSEEEDDDDYEEDV